MDVKTGGRDGDVAGKGRGQGDGVRSENVGGDGEGAEGGDLAAENVGEGSHFLVAVRVYQFVVCFWFCWEWAGGELFVLCGLLGL